MMEGPVRTLDDLVRLTEECGYLPFFRCAVPGFSLEERIAPEKWFTDGDGPWEWKGPVIERGLVYAKLFAGRAVFATREAYLDLCCARREGVPFDVHWDEGTVTAAEKQVWDVISQVPSMLSRELRAAARFSAGSRFDTAVTRLQMRGFLVISDFEYERDRFGRPYGWGTARYAVPERLYGSSFAVAVETSDPEQARFRAVDRLRHAAGQGFEDEIQRLIG